MNILVINQPLDNRGDESAHRSLIRGLNRAFPNSEITVLFFLREWSSIEVIRENPSVNKYVNILPKHTFRLVPMLYYPIKYNLLKLFVYLHPVTRKLIPYYKKADLVICAPGGICMGGFQNWNHLFMLSLAELFHKKLVYYSRSFGPFPEKTDRNWVFKAKSLELLNYFDFLSVRDKKTMDLADELKIDYIPSIDTAFLDYPQCAVPEEIKTILDGSKYMVFVPNKLTWHYYYKNTPQSNIDFFHIELFKLIQKKFPDYKIVMLPQLSLEGRHGDYQYFVDLVKQLDSGNIYVAKPDLSSDIQQVIIRKAGFLIGSRYHSIVFAINNNTPFVALSYEHKISGLLNILNKSDRMVNITDIFNNETDILECVANVETLLNELEKDGEAQQKAQSIAKECLSLLAKKYADKNA